MGPHDSGPVDFAAPAARSDGTAETSKGTEKRDRDGFLAVWADDPLNLSGRRADGSSADLDLHDDDPANQVQRHGLVKVQPPVVRAPLPDPRPDARHSLPAINNLSDTTRWSQTALRGVI